jgi:hypothetical protein
MLILSQSRFKFTLTASRAERLSASAGSASARPHVAGVAAGAAPSAGRSRRRVWQGQVVHTDL